MIVNMRLIMNYLFFYFALTFTVIVSSDEVDDSCIKMFTPEFIEEDCCETVIESDEDIDKNFEGCKADDSDDSEVAKCDAMKCYMKNIGIWKDDEINNEAAKERLVNMESKYPNNKKALQRISKQCLDGKYLEYGTDEICPAMRYFICTYTNSILDCDSWKNTEQCLKNSEYASKCKKSLDSKK